MRYVTRLLSIATIVTISALSAGVVRADDEERRKQSDRYAVTNLVSDISGVASHTDAVLQNAWGVAFSPAASPFWVVDNRTGCSTLYDGQGTKVALQVKIPLPGGTIPSSACQHVNPAKPPSRLLKKSFATALQDRVIAVVKGQLDLDGAIIFEFGRA